MEGDGQKQSARRGRPRRFVPPRERSRLSLDEPLAALSPTALSMLDAGRRIAAERGLRALTIEAIVNESATSRASFVEHFGDRVGYLAILFDSLTHDPSVELEGRLADMPPGPDRLEMYMAGLARLYDDPDACVAYQVIASGALHDPALRCRLVDLLAWYRTIGVGRLEGCEGAEAWTADEIRTMGVIVEATLDGLILHKALDPTNVEVEPALALLSGLVDAYLAQRAAGGAGRPPAGPND